MEIKGVKETENVLNNIPVVITLQYDGMNSLTFQINPKEIRREIPSESHKTEVEGLGEIAVPSSPKLATVRISSFFWQDRDLVPSIFYINWLKKWQKSKEPAKLIVTRLNYSMYVTCESFAYESRAGEEGDYYFDLELLEHKPYGAKKVGFVTPPDTFKLLLETEDAVTAPILVSIPRPSRFKTLKIIVNPYVTKSGDTLMTITKKIRNSSSGWKELYNANKSKLSNSMNENGEIMEGTKLTLPDSWVGIHR